MNPRSFKGIVRRGDDGSAVAMAILMLFIISILIAVVGTGALSSMFQAKRKTSHTVGMAAGDSGIERYRNALQTHQADESNGYMLDQAGLTRLMSDAGAVVLPNSQTSEHWRMLPVALPSQYRYTVRESFDSTYGYWQLFSVIQPKFSAASPSDLIIYLRAWATDKTASATMTSQPRVFRIDYRPGWFSDYQSVTDGPFYVKDNPNFTISGPIHSNGFAGQSFLTPDPGNPNVGYQGLYSNLPLPCTSGAELSTSLSNPGSIQVAGCASAKREVGARRINLLGVEDTLQFMHTRCETTAILVCAKGSSSYDVRLGAGGVTVNGRRYALQLPPGDARPDSEELTVLADATVRLSGAVSPSNGARAARVTIATRRPTMSSPQPDVILQASGGTTVGSSNYNRDSVGVISQGNVIMDVPPDSSCLRQISLAAVSEAGSVTIPPELVTLAPAAINLNSKVCGAATYRGSFAAHGTFVSSMSWILSDGSRTPSIGYASPTLTYNPTLFRVPPPFFPTATPWAVADVKAASNSCLTAATAGDPSCR